MTRRTPFFLLFAFLFGTSSLYPQTEPSSSRPADTARPLYPKGVTWHVDRRWRNATTGVIDWQGVETDLQDLVAADIRYVRTIWQQGVRTNADNDQLVAYLQSYGVEMIPTIYHIPLNTAGTDAEREVYRAWLAEQVNRYKPAIHTWEAYNEPDMPSFWKIDNTDTSDQTLYEASVLDYVTFLQDTYITIKANDPSATVLLGGLSEYKVERWLDAFIKFGGYNYMDKIAYHPYGNSPDRIVERLKALKSKMALNSSFNSKPIVITEIGFHTQLSGNPGMYVPSEEMKGENLRQTLEKLRLNGVEMPIFWYTYEDPWTTENGAGIVAKTGNTLESTIHLPAYYAYKGLWSDTNIKILYPVADASVGSSSPDLIYGPAQTLSSSLVTNRKSTQKQESYLTFDLSSLAGKTINQIILKLKTTPATGSDSMDIHSVRSVENVPWIETGITYSARPQVLSEGLGAVIPNALSKWFDINLNPTYFQANAGAQVSIAIETTSNENALFFSRQAASSLRPQLVVYYNLGDSTPPDWVPPSVFITSPARGTAVKAGSTVTITAEAFDNTGISKVEFFVNGTLICTDLASPYTCPFQVSSKTGVKYTITANAYDPAGNSGSHSIEVRSGK